METTEYINLNNGFLSLGKFPYGKTQNVLVKIGKRFFFVDIDKTSACAFVEFYPRVNKDRTKFSKYETEHHYVHVKENAVLDRKFFEDIAKIQEAQSILHEYIWVLEN